MCALCSVPARLGNGHGAKKNGHNPARERPKVGHSIVSERNEIWAQFCGRSIKTWAQIYKQFAVHPLSENENAKTAVICKKGGHFYILFLVTNLMTVRAGCYVNRAGRKGVRAGHKPVMAGRSTLRNMPRWNTDLYANSLH